VAPPKQPSQSVPAGYFHGVSILPSLLGDRSLIPKNRQCRLMENLKNGDVRREVNQAMDSVGTGNPQLRKKRRGRKATPISSVMQATDEIF